MSGVLVSVLLRKERGKRQASVSVLLLLSKVVLLALKVISYTAYLLVNYIICILIFLWSSSNHPILAYIWVKVATILWALLLTRMADTRCKGVDCITNPECQIIIRAQSTTLQEVHDSAFVAFLSLVRMLSAKSVTSIVHAGSVAVYALFLRSYKAESI